MRWSLLVAVAGCTPDTFTEKRPGGPVTSTYGTTPPTTDTAPPTTTTPEPDPVGEVLADAFRIDLTDVDVVLDVVPDVSFAGHATLTFEMRAAQVRPLFHFDPPGVDPVDALVALTLDGEDLDPTDPGDLATVQFDGSPQLGLELQRDLGDGEHTLVVDYEVPVVPGTLPGWFQTTVDDTVGSGNERLWPTINSPEELAHHAIEVRVHDPRPYTAIASTAVTATEDGDAHVFAFETDREVSSYTVMVAAMPTDDVRVVEFDAGGVPVLLVSTESPQDNDRAVDITTEQLSRLTADFGPLPSPSVNLLMMDWYDGMEYYGATTTGLSSLSHELVHLYWGCSAVNRTWRDTWFDEAVNVWWEYQDDIEPIAPDYQSDLVGRYDLITPGFDGRAYGPGAQTVAAIAGKVGGNDEMVAFLADLYDRRAFAPYTTDDLLDDLVDATGDDTLRDDFDQWYYTP